MVGDQQGPAPGRDVVDAGRLDAPVVVVDPAEDRQKGLGVLGVEAELVDLEVLAAGDLRLLVEKLDDRHHGGEVDDLPPGRLAERRGQPPDRLQREHGRLLAKPADGGWQHDPRPPVLVDLGPGPNLQGDVAVEGFQALALAALARRAGGHAQPVRARSVGSAKKAAATSFELRGGCQPNSCSSRAVSATCPPVTSSRRYSCGTRPVMAR